MAARAATRTRRERRPRSRRARRLRTILGAGLPLLALIVLVAIGPDRRADLLARLPDGAGRRALHAVVSFGALALLAWLALPLTHAFDVGLRRARAWFAARPRPARLALAPFEGTGLLLAGGAWVLFVANAILVLAVTALTLLFLLWVPFPGFLGGSGPVVDFLVTAGRGLGVG